MLLLLKRSACERMRGWQPVEDEPQEVAQRQAGCSLSGTPVPCLQEEVWLKYLREMMHLAREAADEASSSDEDSSGGNGSSGSAG